LKFVLRASWKVISNADRGTRKSCSHLILTGVFAGHQLDDESQRIQQAVSRN
jgi:hypothetical protein